MTTANHVEEPKNETLQSADTYRAPRLVRLGTAVNLLQGINGVFNDSQSQPYQGRYGQYGPY